MARGRPNWDHDSASCFPHRFTDEERRLLFDVLKRNDQRAVEFVDALERLTAVYQIRREEEKNKPTTADRIAATDEIQDLSSKLASRLRGNTVAGLSDWLYTSQVTAVPDIENLRDTLDRLALVCGDAKSRMQEVKKPGPRVNLARKEFARKVADYFHVFFYEQATCTQATDAAKGSKFYEVLKLCFEHAGESQTDLGRVMEDALSEQRRSVREMDPIALSWQRAFAHARAAPKKNA
jgi:hypothetical protein